MGAIRSGKDIFGLGARLHTKAGPVRVIGKHIHSDYVEYITEPWVLPPPPPPPTIWERIKRFFLRKVF